MIVNPVTEIRNRPDVASPGRLRVSSIINGPGGAGGMPYNDSNAVSWVYDNSMRPTVIESASGTATMYLLYDERGNPGKVKYAFSTPGERQVSYTWHPDMNVLLTRTEASVLGSGDKQTVWDYDDDYDAIQEPAGKTKFEPKKLSDNDINTIINYLESHKTDDNKAAFIAKIENPEYNSLPNWEEKKEAITRIILQHAEDKNAWKRTVDIEGEQFYMTDGCHKIEAINGDLKFEMTDGGIVIDSGDKDVTIKCRKFNVVNELEDNTTFSDDLLYHYGKTEEYTYGTSYSEFHGTSTEKFYGDKEETHEGTLEEYFYGNKFGHAFSSVEDFHEGHKLEVFAGSQEEFSFIHSFALFLGIKEEISAILSLGLNLSAHFEYNVLKGEKTSIEIGNTDVEIKKAIAKTKSIDANIESTNIALLKTIAALHQNGITVFS